MASLLQVRRGTKANCASILFAVGEPFFTTDTKEFGLGDGVTVGGILFGSVASLIPGAYMPAYTDLTTLQAIATAAGAVESGLVIPGVIASTQVSYQLLDDDTGVRPDDFDAGTNNRSWHQVL